MMKKSYAAALKKNQDNLFCFLSVLNKQTEFLLKNIAEKLMLKVRIRDLVKKCSISTDADDCMSMRLMLQFICCKIESNSPSALV